MVTCSVVLFMSDCCVIVYAIQAYRSAHALCHSAEVSVQRLSTATGDGATLAPW